MNNSIPAPSLRELIATSKPFVIGGVGTALEALIAEKSGANAIYISGYATAAWIHGVPDIGLIGLAEVVENTTRVARRVSVPVIVDADTGYGEVPQVHETVQRLEAAGASGVQIEDQVWPKRCGHLDGKIVEAIDVAKRKIDAAIKARRRDTVIIARTDARESEGIDNAIARASAYKDCGADVVFIDAPESKEELAQIGRELKDQGPILVNMSESGKTPLLTVPELAELGFQIILYATSASRVAGKAIAEVHRAINQGGDTRPFLPRMLSLEDMNVFTGQPAFEAFDAQIAASTNRI